MTMIENIKNNGQVKFEELGKKHIISLLALWSEEWIKRENRSFSDMLKRCYKSTPWHENAIIFYINRDDKVATTVRNVFGDMYDFEEEDIMNALMK